jgi:hypothetical protein
MSMRKGFLVAAMVLVSNGLLIAVVWLISSPKNRQRIEAFLVKVAERTAPFAKYSFVATGGYAWWQAIRVRNLNRKDIPILIHCEETKEIYLLPPAFCPTRTSLSKELLRDTLCKLLGDEAFKPVSYAVQAVKQSLDRVKANQQDNLSICLPQSLFRVLADG